MLEPLIIEVTQADIAVAKIARCIGSDYCPPYDCVVAAAVRRQLPGIACDSVSIRERRSDIGDYRYATPVKLGDAIQEWDKDINYPFPLGSYIFLPMAPPYQRVTN